MLKSHLLWWSWCWCRVWCCAPRCPRPPSSPRPPHPRPRGRRLGACRAAGTRRPRCPSPRCRDRGLVNTSYHDVIRGILYYIRASDFCDIRVTFIACIWVVIKRSDWLFWSLSDYFGLRVIIIEIRVEECHLCRACLAWAPSPCGRVAPPPPCPAWRGSPPRGAAAPPTAAPCCRARRRRGAGSAPCPGPARAAPAARAAAGCWAGSAAAAGAPARRPCSGCTSGRKIFVWTWENISYWALPWAEPAGSSRKLTVGLGVRWGDLVASGTLKCTIYVIPCNVLIILTCKLECGVLCCVY